MIGSGPDILFGRHSTVRMTNIIFRWAIWNCTPLSIFMLSHSVASFSRFFGTAAQYFVFTDDPQMLESLRLAEFKIAPLGPISSTPFFDPLITWRKWAPRARLDQSAIEFRVDADVFLLRDPPEIHNFCEGRSSYKILCTQEEFTAEWPYGNFASKLSRPIIPINAGFVGQSQGFDLTSELEKAYFWWKQNVADCDGKYHDEQGAVAYCLEEYVRRREVLLLDPLRYRIVCPLNKPAVENIDHLVLMHATYPDHPAFGHFLKQISQITGIYAKIPE